MGLVILVYFIFLVIFAIYSTAGLYHLWRYGYVGDLTRPVMIAYVAAAAVIIGGTFILLISIPLTT